MKAYLTGLPLALAALLVGLAPLPAAAQERTLTPAGNWAISHDAESCTLTRPYSAQASGDTTLYIRSYGPYAPSLFSIVGPTMLRDDSQAIAMTLSYDNAEPLEDYVGIATSFRDQPMLVFQSALPRSGTNAMHGFGRGALEHESYIWSGMPADGQSVVFDAPDMESHTLQLGEIQIALQMLAECEDALLESWGFDAATEANLASSPDLQNNEQMAYWIVHPPSMIVNHVTRIAQMRVRVGASGAVEDCLIQAPSWNPDLLEQACRAITQSAQFEPARDTSGNPVAALWRASMMFIMFD